MKLVINTITHLEIEMTSKLGGKHFSRGEYNVFTPQNFTNLCIMQNDDEEDTQNLSMRQIFKTVNKFRAIAKTIQATGLLIYPLSLVALSSSGINVSPIACAGYILMVMFTAYFTVTTSFFWKAHYKGHYLYRVYSLSGIIPDWTDMAVCYRALRFPYNPIESISEFSAIHGGMGQIYLFSIGLFSWCVLLVSFFTQKQFNDKFQSFGIEICEIVGCYGLLLIGTFELDPFNKYTILCHYLGGVLGVCTIIGFNYQQFFIYSKLNSVSGGDILYRVVLPIVIDMCFIIGYSSWIYCGSKAQKYGKNLIQDLIVDKKLKLINNDSNNNNNNDDDDDGQHVSDDHRKSLNKFALTNVCCEALFLIGAAYSMCLYLVSYEDFLDYV